MNLSELIDKIDEWNSSNRGAWSRDKIREAAARAGFTAPHLPGQMAGFIREVIANEGKMDLTPDVDDDFESSFDDGFPIGQEPPDDLHRLAIKMLADGFSGQGMRNLEDAAERIEIARRDPTMTMSSSTFEPIRNFWRGAWNKYRQFMARKR